MGTLSLTQYSKVANSMPWHGGLVPTRINMRGTKYDFKKTISTRSYITCHNLGEQSPQVQSLSELGPQIS